MRPYKPRKCIRYKTDEERMEAIKESVASWKKENKNKIQMQNERYYLKHRKKILDNKKEYYQKNRDVIIRKAKDHGRLFPIFSIEKTNEILKAVGQLLRSGGRK